MTRQVSIGNYVYVQSSFLPAPTQGANPNNIAIFTTDQFITGDQTNASRSYLNSTSVGSDFGINTDTYNLVNTMFSQNRTLLLGKGNLIIIPMENAVKGTRSSFATDNISANLSNLIAVTDGDLKIITDSKTFELSNLNFTKCTTLEQVAATLLNLVQGYVEITVIKSGAAEIGLLFTSKKIGTEGNVTVEQATSVVGTDLSGATFFNTGSGTNTAGINPTGETLLEAKARIGTSIDYYGFFTNQTMLDSDILAVANDTQSKTQCYFQALSSLKDIETTGLALTLQSSSLTRTIPLGYFANFETMNLFSAAFASIGCSVNYQGSNTAIIMNEKPAVLTPDSTIDDSVLKFCRDAGVYTVGNTAGEAIINAQLTSAKFFASTHDLDALKIQAQISVYNFQKKVGKTVMNATGLLTIKNIIAKVCEQFVRNNSLTIGREWSGETFGEIESLNSNIRDNGYYIYYTPISQKTQEEISLGVADYQIGGSTAYGMRFINIGIALQ